MVHSPDGLNNWERNHILSLLRWLYISTKNYCFIVLGVQKLHLIWNDFPQIFSCIVLSFSVVQTVGRVYVYKFANSPKLCYPSSICTQIRVSVNIIKRALLTKKGASVKAGDRGDTGGNKGGTGSNPDPILDEAILPMVATSNTPAFYRYPKERTNEFHCQ